MLGRLRHTHGVSKAQNGATRALLQSDALWSASACNNVAPLRMCSFRSGKNHEQHWVSDFVAAFDRG
jgi:hypothetical protein